MLEDARANKRAAARGLHEVMAGGRDSNPTSPKLEFPDMVRALMGLRDTAFATHW